MRVGLKPDSVTFLRLLIACNHSGLANEGQNFFNSMTEVYEITPNIEHFCCLIDLLGRAGRVKEALDYMSIYPFRDDPIVLGCLLSACRLYGDVIAGEQMARRLVIYFSLFMKVVCTIKLPKILIQDTTELLDMKIRMFGDKCVFTHLLGTFWI